MVKILVCGSRDWDDAEIIETILGGFYDRAGGITIIEGGANGADKMASAWANRCRDIDHQTFKADWNTHGKTAGPIRNADMLRVGEPDLVLAFTDDLSARKGTRDMVQRAKKAGVPVYVVGRA